MKAKISLLAGVVALVTLSFTFASVNTPVSKEPVKSITKHSEPVGGIFADEVLE